MSVYYRVSTVTSKSYNLFECIKILNMEQCAFYMDRDVNPVDIKLSESSKNGKKLLVFYFNKKETEEVYKEWCAYKEGRELNDISG